MKNKYLVPSIFLFLGLITPLFFTYGKYGTFITLLPYLFVQNYWIFLGRLTSVGFGFYLLNVFWKEKERNDKIKDVKVVILNLVLRLQTSLITIENLLGEKYNTKQIELSNKRDKEVTELIRDLAFLGKILETLSIEPQLLRDETLSEIYIEKMWGYLIPLLNRLHTLQDFRREYDLFMEIFVQLQDCCNECIGSIKT